MGSGLFVIEYFVVIDFVMILLFVYVIGRGYWIGVFDEINFEYGFECIFDYVGWLIE